MKNNLLIFIALIAIGFTSCDLGNDPEIGGTATQEVNGEYFVRLYSEPGGALYVDYTLTTISNTSANTTDKIRINDDHSIWGYNGEFNVNLSNKTFSGDRVPNAEFDAAPDPLAFDPIGTRDTVASDYPKYMTITDGVIISDAVTAPSAATTDSIAFYATGHYYFDIYEVTGHTADTVSTDPLVINLYNIYNYVDELADGEPDGPYFISGYQRTGFLEDEH